MLYLHCVINSYDMKLTAKEEEIMTIFWEHGEMFIRDVL